MTSTIANTTNITVVSVFLLTTHPLTRRRPSGQHSIKAGTPRSIPRPAGDLPILRAAPTGDGLDDLNLFAVLFDKVPDVDDAVQTDVRRFVGRWVWFGCGRVI